MKYSLELCKAGLHIKSWYDRNSSQFGCKCCGYMFEAVKCPFCYSSTNLKQTALNQIFCEICNDYFVANLDIIDDDEPKSTLMEQISSEDDKHEHPLGLRKGFINRDYQ